MEDTSDNKSRRDKRAEEDRKAKDRARAAGGHRDRNRGDREAKSRARGSGGSAAKPGAVAERKPDDDRVSRKGSSRTRDRDEKSKEKSRRSGGRQAAPGAVAEKNNVGDNDDTPMSPRERSRRRKESQASGPSPSHSGSSRLERRIREKEKEASKNTVPAPPVHSNQGDVTEEVPTACAIDDVETVQFEATTVPNITEDQLEAARQQGREEGRNERDKAKQGQQGDSDGDDSVILEASAQKNNKAKKYAFAAFVFVVIVAGIVIWRVMFSGKSDDAHVGPTIFKPPTEDDCLAVSKGLAVSGQSENSVRTYAVEMNFALTPDMELTFLKSELEIRTQRYVLPLLIGCALEDGPIVVENNNFVIANANLELVTMDSPKSCNLGSKSLCSFTYMEMDVFVKDPEVSSAYILELISFAFEHKSLLKVLDLSTPVEMIETQREYEVLAPAKPVPSSLPSFSPSIITITEPPLDPVQDKNCLNIADGKPVDGQEDLVLQEYDLYMDVMLGVTLNDLTTVTLELEEKLQRFLMPALVGCDPSLGVDSNKNRRLTTEGLILNAVVEVEYLASGMCLPESAPPCYRYAIHLDIFVTQMLESADFTAPLMAKFREAPLVPRLGLMSFFSRITVVETTPSPTNSPTKMDSSVPTLDSSPPTTEQPSSGPTMMTRDNKVRAILAEYSPLNEQTLNWLIFVDTWEPDKEDPNHDYLWLERYAMALLYDSTKGSSWLGSNNWKTSEPVCKWYFSSNNECPGPVTSLSLQKNNLSGSLPPVIGNLSQLTKLNLYQNQLTSSIPSSIGNLSLLEGLYLSKNQLTSSIPSSIGNLSLLEVLWLGGNELTSNIPSSIGNLRQLIVLDLALNQLTSSIPSSIGNLSKLTELQLWDNQLTSSIPSSIGNLSLLTSLSLWENELTSNIPSSIGNLRQLKVLDLAWNQLTSSIPSSIGNLSQLTKLQLHENQLTSSIPSSIGNLSKLADLYLDHNKLTGSVPSLPSSMSRCNLDNNCFHTNTNGAIAGCHLWPVLQCN